MRLLYLCLSPTFGMHQYTADLANRTARHGHDVLVVTTANLPRDRYAPDLAIHTPVANRTTGFSAEGLDKNAYHAVLTTLLDLHPDLVHITAPHLWNPLLIRALAQEGIPTLHTLHDLDPHHGSKFGLFIRFWNKLILDGADHIIVHGQTYQQRLLDTGFSSARLTYIPLLHLFLGDIRLSATDDLAADVSYEPWALFFGRIERYKGIEHLLTAGAMLDNSHNDTSRIIIAGKGDISQCWQGNLPKHIELRNRIIDDDEAIGLFRHCGCLVLPYVDATQSALIAAAYYFRKPVVVTSSGALPEYVQNGYTGYIVEPEHPASLARCLQNLLAKPALQQQLGQAGRYWYERQRFAEEKTLLAMYHRVQRRR
jgi:glycosyltransferase involved in cell wall biosynthesis